ncbi:von Willebrand factor A domain-containing protein 5A [Echinococcus granulosus]|uniref:von Willebrand factor A domain-containing protein 5A n=1 Tax=Echinococcus granulosus TaxID=6210 RepID=W6UX20_ECHGR|nr:von Willebrand factor A domain-containing protein 5A [Echinococcus granulosus]EUB58054.1 von Willebrand factor A domain-containing protein 5A [Echinococcus granulosus]
MPNPAVRGLNSLPLKDITVEVNINNYFVDVSSKYSYENSSDELLESSFVFPIESGGVVYEFEVVVGNERFLSTCRERSEAQFIYEEASERNRTVFILLEDEEMTDVFSMKIGNIPPKEKVFVRISYFQKLTTVNSLVGLKKEDEIIAIFSLPVLINLRYSPKSHTNKRIFGQPLQPKWSSLIPYTFHFSAAVSSSSVIKSITSANQQLSIEYLDEHKSSANIALLSHFDFTEDFQMEIAYDNVSTFSAVECSSDENGFFSSDCVLVNFLPHFLTPYQTNVEIIFVIDRSGSMDGDPIQQAAQSLLLFLKSLPVGCRFQIVGFGSTYKMLFSEPQDNTEENVSKALEYQRNLGADMGGTEVLPVLTAVYASKMVGSADRWRREVIFLTDGGVVNHAEIIALVRENAGTSRLSAIGLGQGASTALVSGIARAGNGRALFVRDERNLRDAILDVLNCCLQPWLTDVTVDWRLTRSAVPVTSILHVPSKVPPVFAHTFSTVAALVPPGNAPLEGEVTLSFKVAGKPMTLTAAIPPSLSAVAIGFTSSQRLLHRYAASLQLTELIDRYGGSGSDEDRASVVNLSLAAGIISPFTAFVGLRPKQLQNRGKISVKIPLGVRKHMSVDCLDGVALYPSQDRSLSLRPCFDTVLEEPEDDIILGIAELQLFSGAWTWTHKLAKALSLPSAKKDCIPTRAAGLHEDIWTTALVLAFLRLKAIKRQTEWQLMAKKARDWLDKVMDEEAANQVIEAACQTIAGTT